ncbi:hypothetical protein KHS38_00020 [Mucilaginibacter sp. Bleaf8]|uniref:PulJ/GspJ family protein n=1 Tax=Mucilaginibacter sp. Bleaf8 TaxID=2834430 RepID=UPI001BCF62E3|nr:hypothetical protein [Mucilaginibacter sp. Bleaf8]MBS7562776.1 hypothetical protein [Mucilaginibacter sp. Bleaf8]
MELTIAMLISAIVIAMTYTAYSMMSKAYAGFTRKNDKMAVVVRLDELLQKDFERSESIMYKQDSLIFTKPGQQVRYHFDQNHVIRAATVPDTFQLQTTKPLLYYEQTPVVEEEASLSIPIDELTLTVILNDQQFPYRYRKLYSSENLIKLNAHAIH